MLQLSHNDIHVWHVKCSSIPSSNLDDNYGALITKDELARNARYRFKKDRDTNIVSRILIRSILSRYLDVQALDLRFDVDSHGKPWVSVPSTQLNFNLSHSHDYVVLVVALSRKVGIDIEYTSHKRDVINIARNYFSSFEVEELSRLPSDEQINRFYDYWTLKEAYLKARGEGLTIPLDQFGFKVNDYNQVDITFTHQFSDKAKDWEFCLFRPDNDYRMALAVQHKENYSPNIELFESSSVIQDVLVAQTYTKHV